MIKILHYGISAQLGGIETYSYKLAKNFNMEIFHFDFLYLGNQKPCFYTEMSELGCKFIGITSRKENYIKFRKELDTILKNGDWDIVHLHLNELNNIVPVFAALKYGYKVIVHSRNGGCPNKLIRNIINKINFYRLKSLNVKRVAVSDLAGYWMFGKESSFQVINNGIDIERMKYSHDERLRIRKELELGDNPVIVHIGSFKSQKNHDYIINIFNEIYKLDQRYKLILVGTGNLMDKIKKRIDTLNLTDNVLFLGKRDDVASILSASDYFLFPSLYEGFPNALIEAEASGLLCLVSDTITDNVVIPEICCKLSLEVSPRDWARKLVSLKKLNDRTQGIILTIKHKHDVNSEIVKLIDLYNNLISAS